MYVQSSIEAVPGFKVAGVHCGIKKNGQLDFALLVSDVPCSAAGVFTTNQVKAAPVLVDMEHLQLAKGSIRAVAINSGCANAATGAMGMHNARQTARYIAHQLGCEEAEVLVMSTGVIGQQLPMDKIKHGVDLALAQLGDDWESMARAIMTTDTRPKIARQVMTHMDGRQHQVAGIAKGAGMIAPNMATMLSLIVTDAAIPPQDAHTMLRRAADDSFNRIVIDGDMSTNDTVLLLANGLSGVTANQYMPLFGLNGVAHRLAREVVKDGEGVSKFVTIYVKGAENNAAAHQIANTIATSPLVKTAFFGSDPNWGRILAAAGRAGVPFDLDLVNLWIAPGQDYVETAPEDRVEPIFRPELDMHEALLLAAGGAPTLYAEADAAAVMQHGAISIVLEVGRGEGQAVIWTCDLSHEYVRINADYRS
ncbi:MAG: bifunctional glutamate N-acetyltransferase/amino-acid acetyltransferase ArgJ [Anaerolineae bacterium]